MTFGSKPNDFKVVTSRDSKHVVRKATSQKARSKPHEFGGLYTHKVGNKGFNYNPKFVNRMKNDLKLKEKRRQWKQRRNATSKKHTDQKRKVMQNVRPIANEVEKIALSVLKDMKRNQSKRNRFQSKKMKSCDAKKKNCDMKMKTKTGKKNRPEPLHIFTKIID